MAAGHTIGSGGRGGLERNRSTGYVPRSERWGRLPHTTRIPEDVGELGGWPPLKERSHGKNPKKT